MVRAILVVEPDPQTAGVLELLLRGRGYTVEVAAGASEAVQLASLRRFDAAIVVHRGALLDARLTADLLRARTAHPLVVVTIADARPDEMPMVARKLRADVLVRKPLRASTLLDALRAAFRAAQKNLPIRMTPVWSGPAQTSIDPV